MVNKVPIRDRLKDEVIMGFLCITKCDDVFLDRVSSMNSERRRICWKREA
jgi:hypothetical protein